jgi:hypothetical protein
MPSLYVCLAEVIPPNGPKLFLGFWRLHLESES